MRSFSKERGTIEVDCIIVSENALKVVFDSADAAPHDFEKTPFWNGIYGVYTGSPDWWQFVYLSCKADIESLENEINTEVERSIQEDLARAQQVRHEMGRRKIRDLSESVELSCVLHVFIEQSVLSRSVTFSAPGSQAEVKLL